MTREEAIQIVRKNIPHLGIGATEMTEALNELVPEIRESEDERIRKELIDILEKSYEFGGFTLNNKKDLDRYIAYLEKKEQKPADWSENDEAMRDNILRVLQCFVETSECETNPSLSTTYPLYQREMDWLKSLRPQKKEDEK